MCITHIISNFARTDYNFQNTQKNVCTSKNFRHILYVQSIYDGSRIFNSGICFCNTLKLYVFIYRGPSEDPFPLPFPHIITSGNVAFILKKLKYGVCGVYCKLIYQTVLGYYSYMAILL